MSTSPPDFDKHRTDHDGGRPAEPLGDGSEFADAEVRITEHRRRASTPEGRLRALPAPRLLDRLSTPMLATGLNGIVVYTNPAFATMLGHHPDTMTLTGQRLSALLDGHSATPPHDCVTALRANDNLVVDWLHAEGFPVRSVISDTLFVRATDQIVLIGITDITELMWTIQPNRAEARPVMP